MPYDDDGEGRMNQTLSIAQDPVAAAWVSDSRDREAAWRARLGLQGNTALRLLLVGCSAIVQLILMVIILRTLHNDMVGIMTIIIPILVVAWLFGFLPGTCAGLLSLPAVLFEHVVFSAESWDLFLFHGPAIAGSCACILCGAIIGLLRDMGLRLKRELYDRECAEAALRVYHGRLDAQARELQFKNNRLRDKIDERLGTEAELRAAKEGLEKLIDVSLSPVIIADGRGRIINANKAFLQTIGYQAEELTGQGVGVLAIKKEGVYESTTGETVVISPEFLQSFSDFNARLFEKGKLSNWASYYPHKDGKLVPVLVNVALLYNDQNEIIGSFAIIRDITEQRKAELELIKARDTAEAANLAKSVFLANMSHEIRTPMNGVIGFTDMMLETELDSEQRDYAKTIKRSAEALLSLINDILDFSKIEAGKVTMEALDFDIEVLAHDICELVRPRAGVKGVEILCRIGDDLPAKVKGDAYRVRQVLLNLMSNAAKFTDRGEIELSLEVEAEEAGRILVHTKVRDTGIGIASDKLEAIFEIFEQADSTTTRKYGGTGLGLSICRKIARLMGGEVWAESQGGQGSTFHFTAWLQSAADHQVHRIAPVALAGRKVLVTDDNQTNLSIVTHVIESAGMRVAGFTRGAEAFAALQESAGGGDPFDICVLDIMMPDLSGYELASKIRAELSERMPLLAFSSSVEKCARRCQEAGFSGFLPKPIQRVKLLKMLERLLGEASEAEHEGEAKFVTQHLMREEAKYCISILLAEDNPVNQKLAATLLRKAGYTVAVANNGREAVELYAAEPQRYDIILMDVQMPELSGLDATRQLRSLGHAQVPIIALTANAMQGDREECLAAGMNDYIAKPIKREVVFEECLAAGMNDYIAKPIKREVVFDLLNRWVMERIQASGDTTYVCKNL